MSIADSLNRLWNKITKSCKASFFCALLLGSVAHLPIMSNRLFNHDSLTYVLSDPQSTLALTQGKWANLSVGLLLQGNIASTGIIIPLGLLFLALTAALTVSILKIQNSLWAAITGGMIVLFPSVMSANTFYSSAIFFFSLLLSTVAVFVTIRRRQGFFLGIILLTFSCGIYSVFIGYAAGLFVALLIMDLLDSKRSVSKILISGLTYLLVILASIILYYIILQAVLHVSGVVLSDYRNISQIDTFSIQAFISSVPGAYRKVLYFFVYGIFLYLSSFQVEPMFHFLNCATLMISLYLAILLGLRTGAFRKICRTFFMIVLVVLFPLAIHAIAVLGQNLYTHWIMCYPFILVYIFMVSLADRTECVPIADEKAVGFKKKARFFARFGVITVFVVSVLLVRQWYFTTNQGYEFLRYADQNAISQGVLLSENMQDTEGYEANMPVAFVGTEAPVAFQYITGDFAQVCGNNGDGYTGLRLPITDTDHLRVLLRDYIGIPINYVDDGTLNELANSRKVQDMPIYPSQGSISVYNGYLIVKLSEVTNKPSG